MAATAELDRIDREILRLLMQDAARSLAEIAGEVGLTPTPCWKRIQRMEEQGVITGRVALVDPAQVGLAISVFVAVETGDHSADWIERFAAAVDSLPEIVECWRLGGDVDYLLRVVVPDMAGYDAFYRRFVAAVPALRKVTGRFAMERVKGTTRCRYEAFFGTPSGAGRPRPRVWLARRALVRPARLMGWARSRLALTGSRHGRDPPGVSGSVCVALAAPGGRAGGRPAEGHRRAERVPQAPSAGAVPSPAASEGPAATAATGGGGDATSPVVALRHKPLQRPACPRR